MFWDFGSLYQAPRVGKEEDLFKEGLRASNRWYGSVHSVVWTGPQSENIVLLVAYSPSCAWVDGSVCTTYIF